MPKFEPDNQLSVDIFEEALQAFHVAAGIVLFEFARHCEGYRDIIIRNFIARADITARGVFQLWALEGYHDCWVLHRCLLDRLFHLHYLHATDTFDEFEEWSFLQQCKTVNRVWSDPEVKGARELDLFTLNNEQRKRFGDLSQKPPQWRRPKAEDVAKDMGMRFLYVYGYDFASTHVHPMANDGEQDFHTITGMEPRPDFPDQRTVLSNTLLVATLLVQEGLNASTLLWRQLVYGVFEDLRRFLDSGATNYRERLLTMTNAVQEGTVLSQSAKVREKSDTV
jgi:hypothetical protein